MLLETISKKKSRGVICQELLKVHKVRLTGDEKQMAKTKGAAHLPLCILHCGWLSGHRERAAEWLSC